MQKYQNHTQPEVVISQLKIKNFGICKNFKPTSCHNLGTAKLPNHNQEPLVLQNSNIQIGALK